jgi:hypothetical protein
VRDVAHAYRIAQLVPGAQLVVLDSADHLFWLGDADTVLGEVERLADRAVPTAPLRRVHVLFGLERDQLPVVGVEAARKVLDPTCRPAASSRERADRHAPLADLMRRRATAVRR